MICLWLGDVHGYICMAEPQDTESIWCTTEDCAVDYDHEVLFTAETGRYYIGLYNAKYINAEVVNDQVRLMYVECSKSTGDKHCTCHAVNYHFACMHVHVMHKPVSDGNQMRMWFWHGCRRTKAPGSQLR